VQVLIRNRQVAVRIVALPDDRGLVRLVVEVPVNAVVTDIQLTILVPPDVQIVLRVGNVLDLGKRLDPVDDTGRTACKGRNIGPR
jgi:hypothetical protein